MESIDTVVVGGGQAGLAASYWLSNLRCEHLVLERGRIAERWHSQRWDSLRFQSPNWSIQLPAKHYQGDAPDGFATRQDIVAFLTAYATQIRAPLRTGVTVQSLGQANRAEHYELRTTTGVLLVRNVVIATGPYQVPGIPAQAARLSPRLHQLHASSYRNPDHLPPGGVLVIGSGASGCQIAEELLDAGREVFLCVSSHARAPRRYRGRDVFAWRRALGLHTLTPQQRSGSSLSRNPLITGVAGGRDINLRLYMKRGATLLGTLIGIDGEHIMSAADLGPMLDEADASYVDFIETVDRYCTGDCDLGAVRSEGPIVRSTKRLTGEAERLDLQARRVSTVLWATGYRHAYGWIRLPIIDFCGRPRHHDGTTALPGVHVLGLPWLRTATSSFLCGVGNDAFHVASAIAARQRKALGRSRLDDDP